MTNAVSVMALWMERRPDGTIRMCSPWYEVVGFAQEVVTDVALGEVPGVHLSWPYVTITATNGRATYRLEPEGWPRTDYRGTLVEAVYA